MLELLKLKYGPARRFKIDFKDIKTFLKVDKTWMIKKINKLFFKMIR